MKKLFYSSLLCVVLAQTYMFAADLNNEIEMPANDMRMGNLDNVEDVMDDSDEIKDVAALKAPEVFNTFSKPETQETIPMPELFSSKSMPEITAKDLQGDIQIHRNISKKQFDLGRTLEDLVRKLGGRLPGMAYSPQQMQLSEDNLSEAERVLIKNITKVSSLCRQAGYAHGKVADLYESFQALTKNDFEPGEKLESVAAELSKKATEASQEADKEMELLLGLKPIIKF